MIGAPFFLIFITIPIINASYDIVIELFVKFSKIYYNRNKGSSKNLEKLPEGRFTILQLLICNFIRHNK